jgi:hypothetical protein
MQPLDICIRGYYGALIMVDEIDGDVLMVHLVPSGHDDPTRCRPIGCYLTAHSSPAGVSRTTSSSPFTSMDLPT